MIGPVRFGAGVLAALDGVIVGGESGRQARPMAIDWVTELYGDCKAVGTNFFFKQWGSTAKVKAPCEATDCKQLPWQERTEHAVC